MAAFQFYLQLGKQKSRVSGGISHVVFGKKFPGEDRSVKWCSVMMQQPVHLLP
jgi:hypothetical protein